MKCTYCRQDVHFTIICFKNPQGESYNGTPVILTGGKKRQFNDMNCTEGGEFKQFKSLREFQYKDDYNPPWVTKVNNVKLGFKNKKVKLAMRLKILNLFFFNPLDCIPTGCFASNGRQEVDCSHLDEMSNNPKTPAVIRLDSCDIKPFSLLKIFAIKPKY